MDDLSDSAPVTEIGPILEFDPRLLAAAALSTRQGYVQCLLPASCHYGAEWAGAGK